MIWSPANSAPEARWIQGRWRVPFAPDVLMTVWRRGDRWWRAPRGRVPAPAEWRPLPRRGRPRDWRERMGLAMAVQRFQEVERGIPYGTPEERREKTSRTAGWFLAAKAYALMALRENTAADRDGYAGGVERLLGRHGDPNPRWWARETARRTAEVLAEEAAYLAREAVAT